MYTRPFKLICLLLSLVLLVNMVPAQALAAELQQSAEANVSATDVSSEEPYIMEELPDQRTEYTKVYRLSNGLHMAAVYNEAVHYSDSGAWKEIDNTLVSRDGQYRNTAGVWNVSFPQSMSGSNAVTIEKDGYTLSFYMTGQLRKLTAAPIGQEPVSLLAATASTAQVKTVDLTEEKAAAEYPETVLEKTHSRLEYADVFVNTDVVYDLLSNQVKESVVIGSYDAGLEGYRYTLNTGSLTPVLTDTGEILLLATDKKTAVMTMPAPYLIDDAGETCVGVDVSLTGAAGIYTLTYTLPTAWMADEARQYPVVLDPVVEVGEDKDNVADITVCERNQSSLASTVLNVGTHDVYGDMRTYIMFHSLPELEVSDIVVDATLNLYNISIHYATFAIGVHKVSGTWNESTINWASKPQDTTEDDIIRDFMLPTEAGKEYNWDVTEIVRGWYQEGNTGLVLRPPKAFEADTTNTVSYYKFGSEDYSSFQIPSLTIAYRSTVGIESYHTYATLGVGNAGGVYLSDSAGQITAIKEVASYASTVNPFSANMVYNSVYFLENGSAVCSPLEEMGLNMSMGNGWTLDVIQKIEPMENNSDYIIYHDGDGTKHYFKKSGSKYLDEDGLGLTVEVKDGNYVMRDDMDNTWTFTDLNISGVTGWFMTSTLDNNHNGYTISYNGGKLDEVYQKNANVAENDDGILVAQFGYTGNYLSTVTDATGDSYGLSYSGGNLTQVKRNYNGTSSYTCAVYGYTGSRLTTMTDNLKSYSLHFEYGGTANGVKTVATGRVTAYWESCKENNVETAGVRCEISYPSYTQTTYHDFGNDHVGGNEDDLFTHYLFDYAGRTVNAYTTDHPGTTILGASTAVYTDNEGTSKTNNRTLRTASIGIPAQKIMPRANFEDTAGNWTYSNTADSTEKPRTGKYSLKGTLSASATSAYAKRQSKVLTQGDTYTLSAYVNTSAMTSVSTDGVYLKVTEDNGNSYTSEAVNYKTSAAVDNGWVRIALTFTATRTGKCTVAVYGVGGAGSFYVDDMQLEEGEAPSNYNLLENGDLQTTTFAYAWTLNTANVKFETGKGVNSDASSAQCIRIDGDPADMLAYAVQTVPINQKGAQTYVLSGWGMADTVPDTVLIRDNPAYDHTKQFGLRATVNYKGDTEDTYKEYYYVPFNADITTWQYASLTIVPQRTNKVVDHIDVYCVYEGNINKAYFDDLSLVCTTVQSYEYDTNGNPTSLSSTGQEAQSILYDTDGNIVQIKGGDLEYSFTYDSTFEHRLLTTSNAVFKETLSYDAVGNATGTVLESRTGNSKQIITSSEYTNGGNLIHKEINEAGNATTYGYGSLSGLSVPSSCDFSAPFYETFGIPSTVNNAKDVTTSYVTDTFGRIREMHLEDLAYIKYTYSKTRLHEIQRTSVDSGEATTQIYQFNYDGFDNLTSVGIGEHNSDTAITLMEYDYAQNNGRLNSQEFGNGDTISYTYDHLGRTKTTTYKSSTGQVQRVLTYAYTGDGQLYSIHDSSTGYTYLYTYDGMGALFSSSVEDRDGNLVLQIRQLGDENRDGGQQWKIGSTVYTESYVCNDTDGSVTAFYAADGSTISLGYDVLQRLVSASNGVYSKSYSYRDINATHTTTQVSGLTYSGITDAPSYGYTYDVLGNILTYNEDGITYTYAYDDQGQLTAAVAKDANNNEVASYSYSYDNAGNITGANGHSYGYSDGVWKDQLISYDGHAITYDASGNPRNYYNGTAWSFTWTEGRKLALASGNGHTISYTYDLNGLRTSKTVDNTEYRYVYNDGVLLRQTGDGKTLDFIYDNNGAPYALIYTTGNTTQTFYYITNLQGDVMKLVDEDGNVVASYSYDPYGNILTATGDMAQVNPLRYRGYYFDVESGLYYLQSRYYDSKTGRFLNADNIDYLGISGGVVSYNLYAYCENNPSFRTDPYGMFSIRRWMISAAIDALIWSLFSGGAIAFAALTQPVKAVARSAGQAFIKSSMQGILRGFASTLATGIKAVAGALVPVIKKAVGRIGGKWIRDLTAIGLANTIAGGLSSILANSFLEVISKNITVFLSLGGLIAGLWDYKSDGELNGSIKLW